MRIMIDIDGLESATLADRETEIVSSRQASQPVNGGAGPGQDRSLGASVENDSGNPPQWLLDTIGAAETVKQQATNNFGETAATDTGPFEQ